MRLCEVLIAQELHQPFSEINKLSEKRVYEYIVILDELGKIHKEKMDAIKNG